MRTVRRSSKFLSRRVAALVLIAPLTSCAGERPVPHNRQPDAGLMLECADVTIPAGRLTDNQVGLLLESYDTALRECIARNRRLREFINAGGPVAAVK